MLKGYWPEIIANDGDIDFLMEEFEATDMSIYDFVHGSCAYFAYALAEKFGYDITLVKLYDSVEGRMELCHVYCHTAVNGVDYYIDARGITSDEQQLMDEFDVDLNKDEGNGFIETWYYSKNDLIKDGYVSKDSPITNDILSNARIFIETNMDYYTLQ